MLKTKRQNLQDHKSIYSCKSREPKKIIINPFEESIDSNIDSEELISADSEIENQNTTNEGILSVIHSDRD